MSIYGNPVAIGGGGNAKIVVSQIGWVSTSSVIVISEVAYEQADNNYFTLSSHSFTCAKAGSYRIWYGVKSAYNSGGSRINATAYIYVNGSSVSSLVSSSTGYYTSYYDASLSVDDVVQLRAKNNSNSSNVEPIYMVIEVA